MTTVNLQQASDLLAKSPNTLKAWFKRGCPVQVKGNQKTEWKILISDVLRWREEQAVNDAISDMPDDLEQLKMRKLKAETTVIEIEAAKKRGEVALIEEMEKQVREVMITISTRMMLVPQRSAAAIVSMKTTAEIKELLEDEIRTALIDLAEMEID